MASRLGPLHTSVDGRMKIFATDGNEGTNTLHTQRDTLVTMVHASPHSSQPKTLQAHVTDTTFFQIHHHRAVAVLLERRVGRPQQQRRRLGALGEGESISSWQPSRQRPASTRVGAACSRAVQASVCRPLGRRRAARPNTCHRNLPPSEKATRRHDNLA